MKQFVSIISAVLVLTSSAFGQNIGERVRITVLGSKVVGTVKKKDSQSLTIQMKKGTMRTVTLASIKKIEKSMGTRRYAWHGMGIGVATGVIAAVIAGKNVEEVCEITIGGFTESTPCEVTGSGLTVVAAAVWGTGLGVVGLGIGALIKGEKWKEVTRARAGLSMSPMIDVATRGGQRTTLLGVRLNF